jgi:DNA gyrase subunit A
MNDNPINEATMAGENGQTFDKQIGIIQQRDIETEMQVAYLDYAMSVIVARALPDVRDGLKPVHRRVLYAMHDLGIRANTPYKKCARIVGEVLGKYHPHGDMAVYDTLVRMAQDFSMRYPLIDGQGNFGSLDGDGAAAMRYTEARLAHISAEMLADIDKETVEFNDNFDGTLQEPSVLPALLPNLLVNGTSGIAVGMATNIPPHNLNEIADGIAYLIDNYDKIDEVSVDDLMRFVKGPDFPTGGIIMGAEGIKNAFATGRGRVIVRGKTHFEEGDNGRMRIIVTEIPFQVNKASLVERIAELVHTDRVDSIADLRDESDRNGVRVLVELKRGAQPRKTLNQLLKFTALQSSFGVNMLALVGGEPRTLPLKRMMQEYIEHRREIITRRSIYELKIAKARAHILEGLRIALDHLDEVIRTIRESADADEAMNHLMTRFTLSELQARAILDMMLRRLAALEREKIENEYKEVMARIAYLEDLLANPQKILAIVRENLLELKEQYGDARRTAIVGAEMEELRDEDLVPQEQVLITLTQRGYIKRLPATAFRKQSRGGRGVTGLSKSTEDETQFLIAARTLDTILFFTNKGRIYSERAFRIPDTSRTGKGTPLVNVIALSDGEKVTATVDIGGFDTDADLLMCTRRGRIKRIGLSEFESVRPSGIVALNLEEGDELGWVKLARAKDEAILVSAHGKALRFEVGTVRSMGRSASGVSSMRLGEGDQIAGMDIVDPRADILILTTNGFGKRTPLSEYGTKGRRGKGMWAINYRKIEEIGTIVTAQVVAPGDEVTLISAQGMVLRTTVKQISQQGRATKGTRVMRLEEGDVLRSVARIPQEKDGAPADGKVEPAQAEMELAEQGKSEEIRVDNGNNGVDGDLEELDDDVDEVIEDEEESEDETEEANE